LQLYLDRNEREGGIRSEVIRNGAIIFIFHLGINTRNSAVRACSCKVEVDEREQVFI
jgi:hypothetical protein